MFFITKDGVKDWKEGDAWYKPVSVEGYESTPVLTDYTDKSQQPTGMSNTLKMLIAFFIVSGLSCAIYFLYKKKSDS